MKKFWLYVLGGAGVLVVLAFALIGFLAITRGTPVKRVQSPGDLGGPPAVTDVMFVPTLELLTKMHLEDGNAIEVMINGDQTYPRLWADLGCA
jgi:hypothetical protein